MRNNMMPPQGGLKTDGQQVDPVSGNKVPVGSNANEVRDDIPAQLSDGEYVVPADIVRYYGVKFFEDLRNQGKGGLQDMAANGRIGGEPVPAGGPQATGFSPEETQAMQSMVGAAMGGMMTQQMPPADPYAQQSNMYQQPQGYFDGGRAFATSPTRYSGAFSWETPDPEPTGDGTGDGDGGTGGDQTPVTLYCPDGRVNTLQLPADQDMYDQLITEGCGIDQSILPSSGDDDDGPGVEPPEKNAWTKKYGYPEVKEGEMYPDEETTYGNILDKSDEALDKGDSFLGKLFGGGALGKLMAAGTHAEVAANIAILNANKGSLTPEQQAALEALEQKLKDYRKDNGLNLLPKEFINGDQLAKDASGMSYMTLLNRDTQDVFGDDIFKSSDMSQYSPEQIYQGDFDKGTFEEYATDNNIQFETKAMQQVGSEGEGTGSLVTGGPADSDPVGTTYEQGSSPLEQQIAQETAAGPYNFDINDPSSWGTQAKQEPEEKEEEEPASQSALARDIQDDLAATQAIFEGEPAAGTTGSATGPEGVYQMEDDTGEGPEPIKYTFEEPETTATYTGSSRDDDDDYSIPTVATGTQAYGGSTAAETALIQSDLSDDDFWDEFESGTSGGGSSGSGSSTTTTTTNTASSGRTEADIQADINSALSASGGAWTSELNDLVSERDSARANEGGGSSDDDGGGGGGSSGGGGGCCFIMLEARYGDGTMDEVVRRYRDEYMTDRNRRGYYRMAEVLVPLMRKSKTFKWIVTKTFADPLVSYGKYYYGQNKHGVIYSPLKNFWMKVFDVVGGDTKFIRENGEVV